MSIIDLISPISIGSQAVGHAENSQCQQDAANFKTALTQATEQSNGSTQPSSLLNSAMDIGLLALNTSPITGGVASLGVIGGLMNNGVNNEFTNLGTQLTSGIINALAGQSNTTSTDIDKQSTPLLNKTQLVTDEKPISNLINNVAGTTLSKTDALLFRKGTIPFELDKARLLSFLKENKS